MFDVNFYKLYKYTMNKGHLFQYKSFNGVYRGHNLMLEWHMKCRGPDYVNFVVIFSNVSPKNLVFFDVSICILSCPYVSINHIYFHINLTSTSTANLCLYRIVLIVTIIRVSLFPNVLMACTILSPSMAE